MKIAIGELGTPEWYISAAVKGLAREAGVILESKRFDGGEARRVASVHEGMSELSVALAETVRWTYRAESAYDGWRHTSLRALAAIDCAQWLGVAVRWETRIKSLSDLGKARNLRLIAPLPGGESATWAFVVNQILASHGAQPAELTKRGWRVEDLSRGQSRLRTLDFDVLIAPIAPLGLYARIWHEASALGNFQFLSLPNSLLDQLQSEHGLTQGVLPANYMRGVDEPLSTISMGRWVVFASERLEDDVAASLACAFDIGRQSFLSLHASLDPLRSLDDIGIPVHRAVRNRRQKQEFSSA